MNCIQWALSENVSFVFVGLTIQALTVLKFLVTPLWLHGQGAQYSLVNSISVIHLISVLLLDSFKLIFFGVLSSIHSCSISITTVYCDMSDVDELVA